MRDYVEEYGDRIDFYEGMYVAGGNIGADSQMIVYLWATRCTILMKIIFMRLRLN